MYMGLHRDADFDATIKRTLPYPALSRGRTIVASASRSCTEPRGRACTGRDRYGNEHLHWRCEGRGPSSVACNRPPPYNLVLGIESLRFANDEAFAFGHGRSEELASPRVGGNARMQRTYRLVPMGRCVGRSGPGRAGRGAKLPTDEAFLRRPPLMGSMVELGKSWRGRSPVAPPPV